MSLLLLSFLLDPQTPLRYKLEQLQFVKAQLRHDMSPTNLLYKVEEKSYKDLCKMTSDVMEDLLLHSLDLFSELN